MQIRLIAGLGNPGKKYQGTRHNVGFSVLDALASSLSASWVERKKSKALHARVSLCEQDLLLLKPTTFMNESGIALKSMCSYYKVPASQVVIVYDDVTLDLGQIKISTQGGAGGHNGVSSIHQALGPGVIRFRIGVGPKKHKEMDLADYVLGRFDLNEARYMEQQMQGFLDGLHLLVDKGPVAAMNTIHTRIREPKKEENKDDSNSNIEKV